MIAGPPPGGRRLNGVGDVVHIGQLTLQNGAQPAAQALFRQVVGDQHQLGAVVLGQVSQREDVVHVRRERLLEPRVARGIGIPERELVALTEYRADRLADRLVVA
jgi:hypothetical protein